ncbi:MAG: YARHG domain-containing protein [Bacteroidaceae bacterium]|nr:YARHG domain-containing protein [Bacteroidaceae bacterium]
MKTLSTMMLCLCVAVTIQAQIAGNEWYNGSIQYSAENIGGGKILMNAMDEGEEHECVLVPVAGKTETYKVTDGTNDCVNEYYGMTAKHIKKDGWDVIGFYNGKNQLVALMENTKKFAMHYEQVTQDRWKQQVIGEYTSEDGSAHVTCGNNHITVNGMKIPYRVVSFNGRATGYIQIEDSGTEFDGVWEVVPTYDGIHVYSIQTGEFFTDWERSGFNIRLKESNPNVGRFDYATNTLLTCKFFRSYKKSTLRLMRNAIMARNGYRFQSKDLQEYFGKEPWYKPAASNDNIKLSFIEQLNVELIKAEEENPNHDEYANEP